MPSFKLHSSPLFQCHVRARAAHPMYPSKFHVPDESVSFAIDMDNYKPVEFTAESTLKHSKDPADPRQIVDELRSRPSFYAPTQFDESTGRPLNPFGRTGISGRGKLYNWAANQAADVVLTRQHHNETQLLCIKRGDTGEWAIVGGMIDAGEQAFDCAKREFGEEVLGIPEDPKESSKNSFEKQRQLLDKIFDGAATTPSYQGYVDDARNTDNAWLETQAFHIKLPQSVTETELKMFKGSSDATDADWIPAVEGNSQFDNLYASHKAMVSFILKKDRSSL